MGFLRSPLEFILDTSITWAEFENQLRLSLGTEARLGSNKSVIDIGDGNGFTSRCGLITCDWVGAAVEERLPQKVVIKIPSALPMRTLQDSLSPEQRQFDGDDEIWKEMEESLKEAHNVEVATYEYFKDFDRLSLPRLYHGIPFESKDQIDGQICLEYVENSRMMSLSERHNIEQVAQIARAIGKMQACSLKKDVRAPDLCGGFFERFYTHRTKAYLGMLKGIFTVDNSSTTRMLMAKIENILPDYYGTNLPLTIHKQMGFRPVLVNGDLRTENVLLDKDSEALASLIDWQCTHFGVGIEDLHRIALFALTAENRRMSMPMLVEEMYSSLVENLYGVEPPYSLEKLHLISDLLFPHCALFFAAGCVSLITNKSFESSATNEVKTERMSTAVKGALEDILELHYKNKIHSDLLEFKTPCK
ncbi:hypothetical protein PRIPAC_78153 [Pristionchus pacificus]|uniref:Phosphotransferase n=1 Tax=Pristionchus pacificus TaxID=54126 RepID=A0A2A6C488_PRIPA|nr:hypothetical protein PRIPAC_78153 [Pristionchus pacificus]|eukprot:PDM72863.1 phosphotransferase [Pristionchus pacificus]